MVYSFLFFFSNQSHGLEDNVSSRSTRLEPTPTPIFRSDSPAKSVKSIHWILGHNRYHTFDKKVRVDTKWHSAGGGGGWGRGVGGVGVCLTLFSIYTHFNTLKKKNFRKILREKVKLFILSKFTFFHNVFSCNLYLKIL